MNYFLDTNICVYFLKGAFESIIDHLRKQKTSSIKIPSIVKAELLLGVYKSNNKIKNLEKVNRFLDPFQIIPFDDQAAGNYARIRADLERAGKIIGPNDLIIAATVLANNGILITNNEAEFGRISRLKIQNWTK